MPLHHLPLLLAATFLVICTNALPLPASACRCDGEGNLADDFERSDAVLVGTIVGKQRMYATDSSIVALSPADTSWRACPPHTIPLMRYQLLVQKTYKGCITNDTMTVFSGINGASCGYRFKVGEQYIVYAGTTSYFYSTIRPAVFKETENIFWTNICMRTMGYWAGEIDALELHTRQLKKP